MSSSAFVATNKICVAVHEWHRVAFAAIACNAAFFSFQRGSAHTHTASIITTRSKASSNLCAANSIRRRRADRRRPLAALSCFLHSQPEVLHNLHSQPHHSCKRSASTKQRRRQLHHCSCCGAHSAICVERSKHANMLITWNAKCMCMHTPWCGRLCLCLLHNTHNHYRTPINK